MTLTQWLVFLLIIQIIHGLGTWKLYIKAGRQAWEAFVPVYNGVVLMKIINRPWWWIILLFLPIVNLIMLMVVWVETARSFGKNTYLDTFLAIVTLGFYNYYLNYLADVTYVEDRSLMPKSSSGEWTSSILFAIVAATIVHTYFMQPFTIPSSSLEKSLLVGDFLFVSKFHYGARVPMTTVALPMVHDSIPKRIKIKGVKIPIPFGGKKSYLFDDHIESGSWKNKLQLPYTRIPGFQKINRNDIVVFNQPADTLLDMNDFTPDRNYYKPIDKKTNLVKRCVGLPGDSLEVRNGFVFINGKQNELPDRARLQFSYLVQPKTNQFNPKYLKERYDITDGFGIINQQNTYYFSAISDEAAAQFKNHPNVQNIVINKKEKGVKGADIFPDHPDYNWNIDFFGPLYIPKKDATIDINLEVLPLYKRVITEYEGNTLKVQGNQILINGEVANTYTFKQDYYWMMGDNRHNSIDARRWGFVPFDHVFGKAVFVWMSWDGFPNARWERFFTTVHGEGKPISYLIPFLVLLLGWIGFNKWRKRKKAKS
ncbi:signal peptidase I [Hyunsoonleella flava]|uniref:Signal peptidase I n=1 Tax=Hyunsoonleella flava TaxID=2527939 RepID=A0A4Q9FF93_9FLAO|nr:signal peptidase I [Hyunsoonleella flava]TBN04706.1 signal peptidase I [Hyunsoonleella flava]